MVEGGCGEGRGDHTYIFPFLQLLIPSEPISVAMDAQAHVGEEGEEPLPPLEVLSSSRAVHEKVVVANGIEEVEDLVSNCWGGWLVGGGAVC